MIRRLSQAQADQIDWFMDGRRYGHTVEQVVARAVRQMDAGDEGRGNLLEDPPLFIVSPVVESRSRWRSR